MNCCSNEEILSDTITTMLRNGFNTLLKGVAWLLSYCQLGSGDVQDSSKTSTSSESLFETDTVVSVLFVIHVAVVIAFILSHCNVVKQKSQ